MSNQIITSELIREDPDLIDLIDRFILRLPSMLLAITKAHDEKEWETFSSLIHQMKGVGGNYGYPMLTTLSIDIEVLAKEEKFSDVKNKLDELQLMSENILVGSDENHAIAKKL